MPMFATAANTLEVYFSKDVFLTFKMHADLDMKTLRWLRDQIKRLQVMGKRADKIEEKAVATADDAEFVVLTDEAEAIRTRGGDELDLMVKYIMRACNGWTDYYADKEAQDRGEVLAFDEANIARIGVVKLNKVINAFNAHYGLTEDDNQGKANGASLPAPSPSSQQAQAEANSPTGTATT